MVTDSCSGTDDRESSHQCKANNDALDTTDGKNDTNIRNGTSFGGDCSPGMTFKLI